MSATAVPDQTAAARVSRRWRRWVPLALLVAAIELSYVFIISAGMMTTWPTPSFYGDNQAEGFRSGHLYLPIPPPPALLAAKDPFDPRNGRFWIWDATLYGKHFYHYWGPLPALVLAGVKSILRVSRPIGDQYSVFVSFTIRLIAGALLIERLARRLFPGLPAALLATGILVFAYANPTLYVLARGAIYESAIAGGQAFLVAGLAFAFIALWKRESGKSPRPTLAAAGAAWGLGLACRASIAPVVLLLALATVFLASARAERRWRRVLGDLAAVGAPLGLFVLALLTYNKARFESWFDFGIHRQLTTMSFRTSFSYLWSNLYSYLFRPLTPSCQFPYLSAPWHAEKTGFPAWFALPAGYWAKEPLAGVFVAVPWAWFGVLAVPLCGAEAWRKLREARGTGLDQGARAGIWCLLGFLGLATVPLLPVMQLFIATMRYLEDVIAGIALLGILGAWTLHARVQSRPRLRRTVVALVIAVGLATVAIGFLLGIQGYEDLFQRRNPALWRRWLDALSFCRARVR